MITLRRTIACAALWVLQVLDAPWTTAAFLLRAPKQASSSTTVVTAWNDHDQGRLASYSDDWLLDFHNRVQHDRILSTDALLAAKASIAALFVSTAAL